MTALLPTRRPRSRARSRHVPAHVFSTKCGDYLRVESGLEHDLVRLLDRSTTTAWLVAQPVHLRFDLEESRRVEHVPDLLHAGTGGEVTIWDCRPDERQDDDFLERSRLTRMACAQVGWLYEVFAGQLPAERLNERWLSGFRRDRPWHDRYRNDVLAAVLSDGRGVGDLLDLDDGSGEFVSTMWHLLWAGELRFDDSAPLRVTTTLWRAERA
ncbi:TnsA-like heteromeric transposase endonuclease subunit [Cellulomonas hominis]|uniref:TnsA-like heteromeric transposase endonuclease subunit n=1 Tax=Cellulomonas hominis TaxID=156981 RepID=UPI001443FB75|nr:TnsA-like heteromeric transposase endonuclease subunit [Cellulomonas hominis]